MNTSRVSQVISIILLLVITTTAAAQSVRIRQADGSRWRGEIGDAITVVFRSPQGVDVSFSGTLTKNDDRFITIEGDVAGEVRPRVIFKADIVTVTSIDASQLDMTKTDRPSRSGKASAVRDDETDDKNTFVVRGDIAGDGRPGVILLPLSGDVGTHIRADLITKIGKEADRYGPGQIIVLLLETNGGSAPETERIGEEIQKIKKRHRVVSWVKRALSAGCETAMNCNEIYFMTEGTAGSVTTWNPGTGVSIKGEELEKSMEHLARVAEANGYNKYVAYSMKTNSAMCSYDKDPETGEVTFYPDLSGEFLLSDADSNLCFTARTALHCGFSKGTADTKEDLAKLLQLPEWNERSDYGEKIAEDWNRTIDRAQKEIARLFNDYQFKGTGSGDSLEILGVRTNVIRELINWWGKAPIVMQMNGIPPQSQLEYQLRELQKQIADIRRQERRR